MKSGVRDARNIAEMTAAIAGSIGRKIVVEGGVEVGSALQAPAGTPGGELQFMESVPVISAADGRLVGFATFEGDSASDGSKVLVVRKSKSRGV